MRTSARSAHSRRARRLSRPMSSPVGFWKFGTRYSNRTRRPWRRKCVTVCSSACMSMPSRSCGTPTRSARAFLKAEIAPVYVGNSTRTVSPGSMSTVATRSRPCCDPLVMTRCSKVERMPRGSSTLSSASTRGRNPRVGPYCSAEPSSPVSSDAAISRKGSHGKVVGSGYPGANEIRSGMRAPNVPILRIADSRICSAACEKNGS